MMAGAVATSPDATSGQVTEYVSAYVVLADGAKSRVFKVGGSTKAPGIEELSAATTLDLRRFQEDVKTDLAGLGDLAPADATVACEIIRVHLRCDLGV